MARKPCARAHGHVLVPIQPSDTIVPYYGTHCRFEKKTTSRFIHRGAIWYFLKTNSWVSADVNQATPRSVPSSQIVSYGGSTSSPSRTSTRTILVLLHL